MSLRFPALPMLPMDRYATLLSAAAMARIDARIATLRARLCGRIVWNISSTSVSGGVAEMIRSLLAYARGAGVDARWAVIDGPTEFFRITKRLHNGVHGSVGDSSQIGEAERTLFERVAADNAAELAPMVRPHDVAIVHDPQPVGMVPALVARGAHVIWRCHIGPDAIDDEVDRAWTFLAPYVRPAHAYVFSRAAFVPASHLDASRAVVIPPTIDPFSAKNQAIDNRCVVAVLNHIGLVRAAHATATCTFQREDGSPGRVDRTADIVRDGPPPEETIPLVVQVSRWDSLKDPIGVVDGFARLGAEPACGAHLVLAGPAVTGVGDDPEGASVLAATIAHWRRLPDDVRRRVHLASFPTTDVDENAAMVNALQRHATVIVQKSLHEGFGLTVTEAMWKARPIVASAVGGIQDQLEDGVQGLLLADPTDLDAFADAIARLFADREAAQRMGARGHARVLERYLGVDSLLRYGDLIELLDGRQ